jgi:hypothetical protein
MAREHAGLQGDLVVAIGAACALDEIAPALGVAWDD